MIIEIKILIIYLKFSILEKLFDMIFTELGDNIPYVNFTRVWKVSIKKKPTSARKVIRLFNIDERYIVNLI